MELFIYGETENIITESKKINVLLVGKPSADTFRQSLNLKKELFIFRRAVDESELELSVKNDPPDVIISFPDSNPPEESFEGILLLLCRLQMNSRTLVLCDNPFRYLHVVLKAKVAALLCLQIDQHDLEIIIREVCAG
jgi:hypothetical protein